MFDKFGEFESSEEINEAAAGLLREGDRESIVILAKENGIDKADAEDYIDGVIDTLTTPVTAAFGKLDVEKADLGTVEIMNDWVQYIKVQCTKSEELTAAVRSKTHSLKGCLAALLNYAWKNQYNVPTDVVKAAGVSASRVTLGIPGTATAKKIIKDYYLGKCD